MNSHPLSANVDNHRPRVDSATMHMEEAANLISSLQQTLSGVDAVVAAVNERSKRTILHIETAAQRLIQSITEHRHKLVVKVGEITDAKLQALQAEKDSVQDHFRDAESALRYAPNSIVEEDSKEWETAISKELCNLRDRSRSFDFEQYNEDLKFHFLYQDEELLAAICNFGDVFTTTSDDESQPRGKVFKFDHKSENNSIAGENVVVKVHGKNNIQRMDSPASDSFPEEIADVVVVDTKGNENSIEVNGIVVSSENEGSSTIGTRQEKRDSSSEGKHIDNSFATGRMPYLSTVETQRPFQDHAKQSKCAENKAYFLDNGFTTAANEEEISDINNNSGGGKHVELNTFPVKELSDYF